jgi:PAS domain S-box-containing protein
MSTPAADPLRVLVIDDDRDLLRTVADILRRRGYEPHTAASGVEGLRLAEAVPQPAIALIDLRLPDMDGMQVVGRLREITSLTEVVVLTGHATIESAVGALRQQSYDYLIKPVAPAELLATLSRASERWLRHRAEAALRRGEERFRRLIEGIADVVFLLDDDLVVRYVSPSVVRALGLDPDHVVGRVATELLHASDRAAPRSLAECLRDPGRERALEVRARHQDGSWRLLQISLADLRDQPEMQGLILTARDITEQRQLEKQALQANRLDSIGRLAGGLAHDFNNILSVIVGSSELARREPGVQDSVLAWLHAIEAAGGKAARLIRQLLQFASRQPGQPRVFGLRELVVDLESLLRRLVSENIELVTDFGGEPPLVRADPSQIEQVVLNLVVNARDAMPDGGRLAITTRLCALEGTLATRHPGLPAGRYALLAVQDSGEGMSEDVRARALEPFFTTKESGLGSGLGLSICYGIVRQAGGSLGIDTGPGRGTRIEVVLPAAPGPAEDPGGGTPAPLPGGAETILLVEDDAAVREVGVAMLARLGYRVISAADGHEALERMRSGPDAVDLLLTDVVMPRMSGLELAQAARRIRPETKVLFVSGYFQQRTGAAPMTPGMVVQKPFTSTLLANAVRMALDAPPRA